MHAVEENEEALLNPRHDLLYYASSHFRFSLSLKQQFLTLALPQFYTLSYRTLEFSKGSEELS